MVGTAATPLPVDRAVVDAVHASRLDALDRTWRLIALAGGSGGLGVVVLASCVLARRRGGPGWLTFLIGAYAGTQILFWSMKLVVDRPRPPLSIQLTTVGSASYPSGHTAIATAVAAALCVAATRARRPLVRRSLLPLLVALPLVVGLSRIALGVHWFSDVVGGALLGLGWVLVLAARVLPGPPRRDTDGRAAGGEPAARPSRAATTQVV
ncbi:MAG: phosphatase PAP2 family protein [Thermoleophilia bacterium]|nr:phosphatase PAP2 family protein [Thermoleophilia bacterium]